MNATNRRFILTHLNQDLEISVFWISNYEQTICLQKIEEVGIRSNIVSFPKRPPPPTPYF
jgi:hypothetical protein